MQPTPLNLPVSAGLYLVVAADNNLGIGKNNTIPWRIKEDMRFFKELTSAREAEAPANAVLMGRKTWESIPANFRPLKDRLNIVISRNSNYRFGQINEAVLCSSLSEGLKEARDANRSRCFIIGGSEIYAQAIALQVIDKVFLTQIMSSFECDKFLPEFRDQFHLEYESKLKEENGIKFCFQIYDRLASTC